VRISTVLILTYHGFFDLKSEILKPRWLPTKGLGSGNRLPELGILGKTVQTLPRQNEGQGGTALSLHPPRFFLGGAFRDLDDLNVQLRTWLDTVANPRVHATTRRVVNEASARRRRSSHCHPRLIRRCCGSSDVPPTKAWSVASVWRLSPSSSRISTPGRRSNQRHDLCPASGAPLQHLGSLRPTLAPGRD
jgi:hypothetical protein